MRVDRLLYYLRFAKSRSRASNLVNTGHLRCNGIRIERGSLGVREGDVLTLPPPTRDDARPMIVEILAVPERRGPPREARNCYRRLDRPEDHTPDRRLDDSGESAIAARQTNAEPSRGPSRP